MSSETDDHSADPDRRRALWTGGATLGLMLASTAAGFALKPKPSIQVGGVDLRQAVPTAFSGWASSDSSAQQMSLVSGETDNSEVDRVYDQVLMRTYRDAGGQSIMLALAYIDQQRQEGKIHRPELCYVAQGFQLQSLRDQSFNEVEPTLRHAVPGKRMVANTPNYGEAVSYWIRIGSIYSDSAVQTRLHILAEGLSGRLTDGILVRVSQAVPVHADPKMLGQRFAVQERFLGELMKATDPAARHLLAV